MVCAAGRVMTRAVPCGSIRIVSPTVMPLDGSVTPPVQATRLLALLAAVRVPVVSEDVWIADEDVPPLITGDVMVGVVMVGDVRVLLVNVWAVSSVAMTDCVPSVVRSMIRPRNVPPFS